MTEPYDPNWRPDWYPQQPPVQAGEPAPVYTGPPPTMPPPTAVLPAVPPAGYPGYGPYPAYRYPGSPAPGGPPPVGPPAGSPPAGRRSAVWVAVAVLALLVAAGGAGAVVLLARQHSTYLADANSAGPAAPVPLSSVPSYTIPPLVIPGLPTGSAGGTAGPGPAAPSPPGATATPGAPTTNTADQRLVAASATTFLHALAAGRPAEFCPLWDPDDLRAVLAQTGVTRCEELQLRRASGRITDAAFAVTDPSGIRIQGGDARIPHAYIVPAGYPGDVVLHRDVDGRWKVVFTAD